VANNRFLSDQVSERDDGVALRANSSGAQTTHESVAFGATLLADGADVAGGALVHRVLEQASLSPQFGLKKRGVQTSHSLMAESIGVLLAGSFAIALLSSAQRCSTDLAGGRRTWRV
jgi:hypothetical protein